MIEIGTKIKLEVENIIVNVVSVYESNGVRKVRYEGQNGERGVLLADKIKEHQIVKEEYKLESTGRKVLVYFDSSDKGATRILYKDRFGYCVKHLGSFEKVVEVDGEWALVATPIEIGRIRNP
jgi:hypothetical protein